MLGIGQTPSQGVSMDVLLGSGHQCPSGPSWASGYWITAHTHHA